MKSKKNYKEFILTRMDISLWDASLHVKQKSGHPFTSRVQYFAVIKTNYTDNNIIQFCLVIHIIVLDIQMPSFPFSSKWIETEQIVISYIFP